MATIRWPAQFNNLIQRAAAHESAGQWRAASETYLLAAACAPDTLAEHVALVQAFAALDTIPHEWFAQPQGDGDPGLDDQ